MPKYLVAWDQTFWVATAVVLALLSTAIKRIKDKPRMSLSDLELVAQAMAPTNQAVPETQAEQESDEARALTAKSSLQRDSGQSISPAVGPHSDPR